MQIFFAAADTIVWMYTIGQRCSKPKIVSKAIKFKHFDLPIAKAYPDESCEAFISCPPFIDEGHL
jgi:hypothetical protein